MPSRAFKDADIAIVGMGCRFPGGADNPESFWNLMAEGLDGIVEIPEDRMSLDVFHDDRANAPGKFYVRHGGFLRQRLDEFDAQHFGMSPREAAYLDPQQRLLLETAFEALDDAGIPAADLVGSDTGVFIGGFMIDSMLTQFSPLNRDDIGQHTAVSSTLTILSNRLSYMLDLHGPSITMDTACSSSLVAMHQACQAMRSGECSKALVGGVNVILRPETLIAMCKGGFLSRDGRSKSFDSRADGYGRGEGAGVIVLKRLEDALADNDRIYALVRGSGVNQDGRTDGITVPNPHAQEALIRRVCLESGTPSKTIKYVEAHGTGTAIGDPLEMAAIGAALGSDQDREQPCVVGSVKANIGHLEAAAGIAGVIKTALCLHHNQIPPVANLQTPNPAIDFKGLGLSLPRAVIPLYEGEGEVRAAVNSFGYGGTNAHVILERAPANAGQTSQETRAAFIPSVLTISARTAGALKDMAQAYSAEIEKQETESLADICYSAAVRRGHHEHRLAVIVDGAQSAKDSLANYLSETEDPRVVSGVSDRPAQDPVFVFSGMGPQWWAMGRELYENESVFRSFADAVDVIFSKLAGWSIVEEMMKPEDQSRMAQTQIAQPANFVLQGGLAELWKSWGVKPSAVLGHSVGEVTSAYVAGALSLEDAVRVSYYRSLLQARLAGQGTMLAVGASESELAEYVAEHSDTVSFAALNGPSSITLAGDEEALRTIAEQLSEKGVFNRFLKVEMAYHSPVMDKVLDELAEVLQELRPRTAHTKLYSSVTGVAAVADDYDGEYWCRNVREPVYFARAIGQLLRDGHELFLEVGPHPVLSGPLKECLQDANVDGRIVTSLRRNQPERATLLRSLGELHVAGSRIDWGKFYTKDAHHFVRIPTYPWQRQSHWNESERARVDRLGRPEEHPLLGSRASTPNPSWQSTVNRNRVGYVTDHKVEGSIVLPGAAYVEIGLALASAMTQGAGLSLEDLSFSQALLIDDLDEPEIHTSYDPASRSFLIYSRLRADEGGWTKHAGGRLSFLPFDQGKTLPLAKLQEDCNVNVPREDHYDQMRQRGLQYGPAFQGVVSLGLSPDRNEVLARIETPSNVKNDGENLHPALLDACFQSLIATVPISTDVSAYVPVIIQEIRVYAPLGQSFWCHGICTYYDKRELRGDIRILDDEGKLLAELKGISARALGSVGKAVQDDYLYRFHWTMQPLDTTHSADKKWLLLTGSAPAGGVLVEALESRGALVTQVRMGTKLEQDGQNWTIRSGNVHDLKSVLATADYDGVVCLRTLDAVSSDDPIGLGPVNEELTLLQAIPQSDTPKRVVLVVREGAETALSLDLSQASAIGLARVAVNEFTNLNLRMVRLGQDADPTEQLADEILSASTEDDVALRQDGRFVSRLERSTAVELEKEALAQRASAPLGTGDIEIEIQTAIEDKHGWTDVLAVVTGAGASVAGFKAGDRIVTRLQGPAPILHRLPEAVALHAPENGAELIPLALVHHALLRAGNLKSGETVLIYPDDGLMGRAAFAVAKAIGAKPLTLTGVAGSSDALALLREQHPAGVNSIFSTVSDEITERLPQLLVPFGTFVALGETTSSMQTPLAVANCTVSRIDSATLFRDGQAALQKSLDAVAELINDGVLDIAAVGTEQPIIDYRHDLAKRQAALSANVAAPVIDGDGSYLVTGGFGGFGFEIAKWLVARGARHLVLVGRKGASTPEGQRIVDELSRLGAKVLPVSADIAVPGDVSRLLAAITESGTPLKGIFHAAAVLDDGPIYTLTPEQMTNVMRPKALGAWNLHAMTKDLSLSCFVMLSSIASLIGSPGQATYVAANTFLDTLAEHRRALGLPAISINLGALSEVGMAARHEGVERHLERVGVGSLTPSEALGMFDRILAWNPVAMASAKMNWALWGGAYTAWAASTRYRHLMPDSSDAAGSQKTAYEELSPAEREEAIGIVLVDLVAGILGLPADTVDHGRSLLNMGVDSLMAMELQAGIDRKLGLKIPTLDLMKGISFGNLIKNISASSGIKSQSEPKAQEGQILLLDKGPLSVDDVTGKIENIDDLLARLSEMNDSDVENAIKILSENQRGLA